MPQKISEKIILQILGCLPPEKAHALTLTLLALAQRMGTLPGEASGQSLHWKGLSFPNRVGLSAGFDKNGDAIDAIAACGFGFIEIGTVTPKPQLGNLRPRLFRLRKQGAIINRMGFNNKGVDYVVQRLMASSTSIVKGVNIGKNVTTPINQAIDDYMVCLQKVYPWCDYVVANVSSPNTSGLRSLQHGDDRTGLFSALAVGREKLREEHQRDVPLLVKVSPDLDQWQLTRLVADVVECGLDGIIATNTTTQRPQAITASPHCKQKGGLSGAPLTPLTIDCVRAVSRQLPTDKLLIGSGGIADPQTAMSFLHQGAQLVQLYTALVYQGTELITQLVEQTNTFALPEER